MTDFTSFVKEMHAIFLQNRELKTDGCGANLQLIQVLLGLQEEVGELSQLHSKNILYGRKIDKETVLLELGDIIHYVVSVGIQYDYTLEDIIQSNVTKITKRKEELDKNHENI